MTTSSIDEDVADAAGVILGERGAKARLVFDRRSAYLVGTVLIAIALVVVGPRLQYALTHETTDDAYVDARPAVVSARLSGTVSTIAVQPGQFMRQGDVLATMDDTDQRIALARAEQTLAEAESNLAQARYDVATAGSQHQAQVLHAQALATQSEEKSRALRIAARSNSAAAIAAGQAIVEAESALRASEADVPAAQTRLRNARKKLERMQALENNGYIGMLQVEAAETELAQADADYRKSLAAVREARANLEGLRSRATAEALLSAESEASANAEQSGVALARSEALSNPAELVLAKQAIMQTREAERSAAREQLQLAQYNLRQTVLKSPVDGYVASRPASVGQTVQNGDPVVVVMPSQDLYVTANFKETQLGRVRPGAKADVHIDAYPGLSFYGHVETVGAASQSALSIAPETQISANFVKIAQRIPIRIILDGSSAKPSQPLRPGMSAEVSVVH